MTRNRREHAEYQHALPLILPEHQDSPNALGVRDMAHALADTSWQTVPLNGKRPARAARSGVYSATCDPLAIDRYFTPGVTNIGIQVPAGYVVLDHDPRNSPYDNRDDFYRAVSEQLGGLPPTVTALTGGGGLHLYYMLPDGIDDIRARPEFGRNGVDVLCYGKYVVGPPSIHPDTRAPYVWYRVGEVQELPALAFERLKAPQRAVPTGLRRTRANRGWHGLVNKFHKTEREGNRNNSVNNIARKFFEEGQPPQAFADLTDAALDLGLPLREIQAAIASAQRYVNRIKGVA